jgi:hypothetical protein
MATPGHPVIPAKAGIHLALAINVAAWILAFAAMTIRPLITKLIFVIYCQVLAAH